MARLGDIILISRKKVEIMGKNKYNGFMTKIAAKTGLSLALLAASIGAALAQDETPWQEGDFAKSRLIASHKAVPEDKEGPLYLGWQVKLEDGWKTYWRTPGSAGLPPKFNWEGSVNIAGAEVFFPTPDRFEIFDLHTYGYHDDVVYPIRITPAVAGAPVTVRLEVNYLVCSDLCVPVSDHFELTFPAAKGGAPLSYHAGLIDRYLALVPKDVAGWGEKLTVTRWDLLGAPGAENIILNLKGENLLSGADLVVEDMEGFKFGVPKKRLLRDATEAEFIIPVYPAQEGDTLAGREVVLVVFDGWDQREQMTLQIKE